MSVINQPASNPNRLGAECTHRLSDAESLYQWTEYRRSTPALPAVCHWPGTHCCHVLVCVPRRPATGPLPVELALALEPSGRSSRPVSGQCPHGTFFFLSLRLSLLALMHVVHACTGMQPRQSVNAAVRSSTRVQSNPIQSNPIPASEALPDSNIVTVTPFKILSLNRKLVGAYKAMIGNDRQPSSTPRHSLPSRLVFVFVFVFARP